MGRGLKFAKKTIIYSIGSLGSKLLVLLLLPVYTFYLDPSSYGQYDVLITTTSLLMPIITLQTQESIIKGMLDKNKESIVKSSILIFAFNSTVFLSLFLMVHHLWPIKYGMFFCATLIAKSCFSTIQQLSRGLSNSKLYAGAGIMYTFVYLIFNILLLVVCKFGIEALFISDISASLITTGFILFSEKRIFHSILHKLDKSILKWMILYSLPLVPNAISWWFINASDRYVVNVFLGYGPNGIYAVSYKFAAIVQTVTGLIYLAWQEVSLEEYNSTDKSFFLTKSFDTYCRFLLSFSAVLFCSTKFVVENFFSVSYIDAWKYTSGLYYGTAFIALASQLNTCYLANGNTKEILKGTLVAGAINIIIDILLIKKIGLHAASISTVVSAFVLVLIRIRDNKKHYPFNVDWKNLFLLIVWGILITSISLVFNNNIIIFVLLLLSFCLFIFQNQNLLLSLWKILSGIINNVKRK